MGTVATMLEDAEPDILAFYVFPPSHWRKRRGSSDAATSRPSRCLSSSRGRDDHTDTEITREGAQLQPAWAVNVIADDTGDELLHRVPGLHPAAVLNPRGRRVAARRIVQVVDVLIAARAGA